MTYFPESWLNELLSKTDIVHIVSDYVTLSPKGGRYWGCCPFHNEKTPSFSVQPDKQMYYCFGCHAGGGVIHFVMEAEHLGFVDAVKLLAQRAGMELPDEVNDEKLRKERAYKERLYAACKEAARFYNAKLLVADGKGAQAYLNARQISGKMAMRFGLGYAPEGWQNLIDHLKEKGYSEKEMIDAGLAIRAQKGDRVYDAYRDRLIFPIISATGRVIGFGARTMKKDDVPKYINTGDTPIYNKRNNLYALNMQKGKRTGELIMVEGYMDVISLFAAGIENAVASLGTAMTQQQARLIKRYAEKMYLCYDGDAAGQAATLRGLDVLSAEGVEPRVIVIPNNMDPDDYVKKYGKNGFLALVDKAMSANLFRLENMALGFDLKSEDGREAYAKKACAFLNTLQPVEKERYIAVVVRKTGLKEGVIRAQCGLSGIVENSAPTKNRSIKGDARKAGEKAWSNTELMLLSLMLTNGETAAYCFELMEEKNINFSSDDIAAAAQTLLEGYALGNTNTALIISEMPPEQAQAVGAAQAAAEKMTGNATALADDCVKNLIKERLKDEHTALLMKVNTLSGEEQRQCLKQADEIAKKLKLL